MHRSLQGLILNRCIIGLGLKKVINGRALLEQKKGYKTIDYAIWIYKCTSNILEKN